VREAAVSVNSTRSGCRLKSHQGDAAHRMAVYDSLPREIRDRVKIARTSLCCGCVRNELRQLQRLVGTNAGLEQMLQRLDISRCMEPERHGPEVWYVPREDLRP
jgi:hypothetical protein